ncbi:FKBP-type peptidyl-prolyl cis-trans isomerase [Spirosoma sp. KNUC1025]|nr:FKBP-type peptidyl-prolyl cis-trans isomerase [Spirosoma sp. KNUC1025]
MNITKHKVAAIHYTLRDSKGNVLDSSQGRDPLYYLHGAHNLIPGMEEGLEGRKKEIALNWMLLLKKGMANTILNLSKKFLCGLSAVRISK